jgi:hypothetical protein
VSFTRALCVRGEGQTVRRVVVLKPRTLQSPNTSKAAPSPLGQMSLCTYPRHITNLYTRAMPVLITHQGPVVSRGG